MSSVGIDMVRISRLEDWLCDEDKLDFVFTSLELNNIFSAKKTLSHLASVFAIKEAFMKALGTGWAAGVQWKDIEVLHDDAVYSVNLYNRALRICGDRKIYVSAGLDKTFVIAMVMLGDYLCLSI